jgi:hypothetical protein
LAPTDVGGHTGIAAQIPSAAATLAGKEQELIALCRSREFSLEKLREAVKEAS